MDCSAWRSTRPVSCAYINYTDHDGDTIVSEHPVDADGQFGTGDAARLVLEIEQPYANHNGGDLMFGPGRDAVHRDG